jgi:hypothetical protein
MIKKYSHLGRPIALQVRQEKARGRAADLAPVIKEIQKQGITTLTGIAQELNAMGHTAARGGSWSPTQVMYLLRDIENLEKDGGGMKPFTR